MIADASAILAVLFDEAEKAGFRALLPLTRQLAMSPADHPEASVRADDGQHPAGGRALDGLPAAFGIRSVAIGKDQARLARAACPRFGKGNRPARLDPGDRFAHALAKVRNEPLPFEGEDFRLSDVEAAT